LEVWLLG